MKPLTEVADLRGVPLVGGKLSRNGEGCGAEGVLMEARPLAGYGTPLLRRRFLPSGETGDIMRTSPSGTGTGQ